VGWLGVGQGLTKESGTSDTTSSMGGLLILTIRFGFVALGSFTRVTRLENVFQTELYESRRDGCTYNFAKARDADDRVRIVELRVSAALTTTLSANQRSYAGRARAHSPRARSGQLSDRRPEWCGRTTGHEANLIDIQDAQASHKSPGGLPARMSAVESPAVYGRVLTSLFLTM